MYQPTSTFLLFCIFLASLRIAWHSAAPPATCSTRLATASDSNRPKASRRLASSQALSVDHHLKRMGI